MTPTPPITKCPVCETKRVYNLNDADEDGLMCTSCQRSYPLDEWEQPLHKMPENNKNPSTGLTEKEFVQQWMLHKTRVNWVPIDHEIERIRELHRSIEKAFQEKP